MTISVVIPTFNEVNNIGKLVEFILQNRNERLVDVIVSDGGSSDNTVQVAMSCGANAVTSPIKGRSAQMNYGASISKGDIIYFVHADSFPPSEFILDIQHAVNQGYSLGRFRSRFDSKKTILKLNAWFTRFDLFMCMGGDQTLFVTRTLFEECHGFNEQMQIMEDYDFSERARKKGKYKIFEDSVLISARKYLTNSWLRVQLANLKIVRMYRKGATQKDMVNTYHQMLSYRNNAF